MTWDFASYMLGGLVATVAGFVLHLSATARLRERIRILSAAVEAYRDGSGEVER